MVLAILYAWLYNNTRGTLLLAILFHTAGNSSAALLPPSFGTEPGRWENFGLLFVTALIAFVVWSWQTLKRGDDIPQPSLSG
jgi:hypothetical protein